MCRVWELTRGTVTEFGTFLRHSFAIVPMFGEEESEGSSSDSDSDGLSRRRTPRSARSSGSKRRKSGR